MIYSKEYIALGIRSNALRIQPSGVYRSVQNTGRGRNQTVSICIRIRVYKMYQHYRIQVHGTLYATIYFCTNIGLQRQVRWPRL